MSLPKVIGGYFELELSRGDFPYGNGVLLNSGRSCFEYVLKAQGAKRVYMPKYTCDVMFEPLKKLNVACEWYEIDENLEIKGLDGLQPADYIVYTNYFGIKDEYSKSLSDRYGKQLILDCSQAFYFEPLPASHTFYSPRKFFGLPDGGCLFTDKQLEEELSVDLSYERMSHLLKRIDSGAEAGYEDFKRNDASLTGEPIKRMSKLTRTLLGNINFAAAKAKREDNFKYLHGRLEATNKLRLDTGNLNGPMVYPYLVNDPSLRRKLIDNKVFVATYWPNVLESAETGGTERYLATNILPLPIDQRYSTEDMQTIAKVIGQEK